MRRILALVALVAMLVLPPFALLAWGFTDWSSISLWTPADLRLLLGALTVIGWVVWAAWSASVLVELLALLTSGRIAVKVPMLGTPQAWAAAMLAAIIATGPVGSMPATAYATPLVSPSAPPPVTQPVLQTQAAQPPAFNDVDPDARVHTVALGDDLWSLAERFLGDGSQWRRLARANPDLIGSPTDNLPVGARLNVPPAVKQVTVVEGDTLRSLAAEHLGDEMAWPQIHKLNASRITDPDLIKVGWVLQVPDLNRQDAAPPASTAPAPPSAPTPAPAPAPEPSTAPTPSPVDTAAPAASTTELAPHDATDAHEVAGLVGGISSLTAAAVLGSIGVQRAVQARARPLGRRYASPAPAVQRVETALATRGTHDRPELLALAMRHLRRSWVEAGYAPPPLVRAIVGPLSLEFTFESECEAHPDAFERLGVRLATSWQRLAGLTACDSPVAWPALATLGADDSGDLVMVDLVSAGVLGVTGDTAADAVAAMLVELTCAPWASEVRLAVVTREPAFARAASPQAIACFTGADAAIEHLEQVCAQRRAALRAAGESWSAVQADLDRGDAWAPTVIVFEQAASPDEVQRLEDAVADGTLGVAVVLPVSQAAQDAAWHLTSGPAAPTATDATGHWSTGVHPQAIPPGTRQAISTLQDAATATATDPAPWWTGISREPADIDEETDNVKILSLRAPTLAGPRLMVLGPITLSGFRGDEPERARRQCLEYCAWLLQNPHHTSTEMGTALLVAEGTRRSNMSRLRVWLGADDEGELFLPDAYSGRISLADGVSSDWHDLQLLIARGVNRTPPDRLRRALELVRGAPLADAAPGQWAWAEEWRSDMVGTIRDVAVLVAKHARTAGDLELARWACHRGLAAAPDDELLAVERIRIEHAAGNTSEVSRLSSRLIRHARTLGVDLFDETIDLLQEVVEGGRRARRA